MDLTRAISTGALVAAITAGVQYASGNGLNLAVAAVDGGLMAGSVAAADAVALYRFIPPILPPSLVAGGVYTAGQYYIRRDRNIAMNLGVGAAADFLIDSMSM
jgi:hypothetical protein